MAQHILDLVRGYLVQYGYWGVFGALLLENAGLPVPGETVLLLASFLAFSEHTLRLPCIILIGTCAANLGDNLGYAIGYYGGRPLLERYQNIFRVSAAVLEKGERLFQRYGSVTVLFARFVFGMRVIAGPLAGALRMPWRQFLVFNLMGAALWVPMISTVGYLFGRHWDLLLHYIKRADIAFTALAVLVVLWLCWRKRRRVQTHAD